MGMDIMLYEVDTNPFSLFVKKIKERLNKLDVDDYHQFESLDHLPQRVREKCKPIIEGYVDEGKIQADYGVKINGLTWDEDGNWVFFIDSSCGDRCFLKDTDELEESSEKLTNSEKTIEDNYTFKVTEYWTYVNLIMEKRYGYMSDNFVNGCHPFDDDPDIKRDYFTPDEFLKLARITKDPSKIYEMYEEFKKMFDEGKLVLVYNSS